MAPRPTLIGSRVIGVDLPAFLLSKSFYSESIGMSPCGDASGGTYWLALRELAFQLCLPQLALGFCFRV